MLTNTLKFFCFSNVLDGIRFSIYILLSMGFSFIFFAETATAAALPLEIFIHRSK